MNDTEQTRSNQRARPFAEAFPAAAPSLKARKQQVVRDALTTAAMQLFLARGFEAVTVEEIALAAGVSRRTFFRYYDSKEDVMAERTDRLGEQLLAELADRPAGEPTLLAVRNALVPAIEYALSQPDLARDTIRLLRETSALRRSVMERRNRLEERIAALMVHRMNAADQDNTPMLVAFLTRALYDTAMNAWYDHETSDIAGLIDDLIARLRGIAADMPPG